MILCFKYSNQQLFLKQPKAYVKLIKNILINRILYKLKFKSFIKMNIHG